MVAEGPQTLFTKTVHQVACLHQKSAPVPSYSRSVRMALAGSTNQPTVFAESEALVGEEQKNKKR